MAESEFNERLLRNVKKEVKQIMEESVTRKFVHEESGTITALCSAVEACLQHGLRKRALGLFKNSNTTTALLQKVGKTFEPAAVVIRSLAELEKNWENARKSGDSSSVTGARRLSSKYQWIRQALFEKQLAKIVEHLVDNSSKYYEKDALMSDPVDGMILASLLVGPCALDYTRMKTPDHYWTDPPADELVQRHRIHSSGNHYIPAHSDSPKRPGLQKSHKTNSSCEDMPRQSSTSAKEYVESLHQNAKTTLLYGKNNVIVQPKDDIEPLAGYLSLHQTADGLSLKWTPNQLMNAGGSEDEDIGVDRRPVYVKYALGRRKLSTGKIQYWDYALTILLDEIVYLHCHQQSNSGGTVVLVGQDGVQRPPIHFPKGGHLLAFLSCLENGLLPRGQLDPPLWSQRGKGKVFPKAKSKFGPVALLSSFMSSVVEEVTSGPASSSPSSAASGDESVGTGDEETEATDYVFRIVYMQRPENIHGELIDPKAKGRFIDDSGAPYEWMSVAATKEVTVQPPTTDSFQLYVKSQAEHNASLLMSSRLSTMAVKQLCDTMKWQILSRAFYGWLSHCRHLKTVRTHLSGLVHPVIVSVEFPTNASCGVTLELWQQLVQKGLALQQSELYRLVYYGGCEASVRTEIWPYLLGFYEMDSTAESRIECDTLTRQRYERLMSEWLAVETVARQRDKDMAVSANTAKLSMGESQDGGICGEVTKLPFFRKDSSLSNDVFESIDTTCTAGGDEVSRPETVIEESSSATTPTTEPLAASTCEASSADGSQQLIMPPVTDAADGCQDKMLSPDDGLGLSITAPRDSSRSNSERRINSSDTDHGVDIVPSDTVTRHHLSADMCETADSHMSPERTAVSAADVDEHLHTAADSLIDPTPATVSAASGHIYPVELLDSVALNVHRIDKDVHRCDRNVAYFTTANLEKLRNILCTYVWENLEVGYIQGMCDLLAPLLVVFDDEVKTYGCFCQLMKRMSANFPQGGAMDQHFGNMRSLIQILDPELFEHMRQYGDYTHFYFCYRWFLLDFKRELVYDDVFTVWETIWAAKHASSPNFVLFIALALVEYYREIIIDNNMDFTDIIKFFNEMAERHNAKEVLQIARGLVHRLQDLIENK